MPLPRAGRPAARDGPPGLCAVVMQLGGTERHRLYMRAGSSPTRSRRPAPCVPRSAAGRKRTSRRPYGSPAGCSTTTTRRTSGGRRGQRVDAAPAGQAEEARERDAPVRIQAHGGGGAGGGGGCAGLSAEAAPAATARTRAAPCGADANGRCQSPATAAAAPRPDIDGCRSGYPSTLVAVASVLLGANGAAARAAERWAVFPRTPLMLLLQWGRTWRNAPSCPLPPVHCRRRRATPSLYSMRTAPLPASQPLSDPVPRARGRRSLPGVGPTHGMLWSPAVAPRFELPAATLTCPWRLIGCNAAGAAGAYAAAPLAALAPYGIRLSALYVTGARQAAPRRRPLAAWSIRDTPQRPAEGAAPTWPLPHARCCLLFARGQS